MDYQVWTHAEFEGWQKTDCGDLAAAQRAIMEALKAGKEPLLTVAVPFDVNIKVKEADIGKAIEGKPPKGKGPGAESKGEPEPGAPGAVPE